MEAIDKTWTILKTKSHERIFELCEDALFHSLLFGLTSLPGIGKSSTFDVFQKKHPNTHIIPLDKTMGVRDLYVAMLHSVGIYDWTAYMRPKAMAEKFAYTIQEMDKPCLFIFDEAGLFEKEMLLYFHTIFESCKGKLGMILAGTPVFKTNMNRWVAQNRKSGIAELESRIIAWIEVTECSKPERFQVASANGVKDDFLAKEIASSTSSFRGVYNRVIEYRLSQLPKRKRDSPKPGKVSEPMSEIQKPQLL